MRYGIDCAAHVPSVSALKAAGKDFVCRYLAPLDAHNSWKVLRNDEAKALRTAGIDIVLVWESWANRALDGRKAGVNDAREAERQLSTLGAPEGTPVYFAVDFDAAPKHQPVIDAYLRGAASVLGSKRVGVYGGYYVVKRCLDARSAYYGWQTYAWSGGQWDARAHIQQYLNGQHIGGVNVDLDRAKHPDFGQWGYARGVDVVNEQPPKPRNGRPRGMPKRVPPWVWKFIRWRNQRLKANKQRKET